MTQPTKTPTLNIICLKQLRIIGASLELSCTVKLWSNTNVILVEVAKRGYGCEFEVSSFLLSRKYFKLRYAKKKQIRKTLYRLNNSYGIASLTSLNFSSHVPLTRVEKSEFSFSDYHLSPRYDRGQRFSKFWFLCSYLNI